MIEGWIRAGLTSGTTKPLPSPTRTTRPRSRTRAIAVPRPGSLPEQSIATCAPPSTAGAGGVRSSLGAKAASTAPSRTASSRRSALGSRPTRGTAPSLPPSSPAASPDGSETDHGKGIPAADLSAKQALVRRAEAAGHAGPVEEGDEVRQHACSPAPALGSGRRGRRPALPTVRGAAGRGAADLVAADAVVTLAAAADVVRRRPGRPP